MSLSSLSKLTLLRICRSSGRSFRHALFSDLACPSEQACVSGLDTRLEVEVDVAVKHIKHVPVLAREVTTALSPKDGQIFIDMTFGGGGHTRHLLATDKDIRVITLDRDPDAFERSVHLAKQSDKRVVPLMGRFSDLPPMLKKLGIREGEVNGVIMDLGASSFQFDEAERGFAFSRDGPLDMRMDGKRFPDMPTAADVINTLDSESLARIFKVYGEERHSKKYAQTIIDSRFMMNAIRTTQQLAQLISSLSGDIESAGLDALGRPTHAATRVFQALRIFVNNELNELNYALEYIKDYLVFDPRAMALKKIEALSYEGNEEVKSGRLSVITFHSLEDRIVKRHLLSINVDDPITQSYSQKVRNALEVATEEEIEQTINRKWFPVTKHVVLPTEEEVLSNARSRSAKLRTAIRLV